MHIWYYIHCYTDIYEYYCNVFVQFVKHKSERIHAKFALQNTYVKKCRLHYNYRVSNRIFVVFIFMQENELNFIYTFLMHKTRKSYAVFSLDWYKMNIIFIISMKLRKINLCLCYLHSFEYIKIYCCEQIPYDFHKSYIIYCYIIMYLQKFSLL